MINIYSGDEEYLKKNYLYIYNCCKNLGLKSPNELVTLAQSLVIRAIENTDETVEFVSNQPDFVSAVAYGFKLHGLPYQLWLNGKKSDIETVFAFFNEAFDKCDNWLTTTKANTPITVELLKKNGFVEYNENHKIMVHSTPNIIMSYNTEDNFFCIKRSLGKLLHNRQCHNLYHLQQAIDGQGIDFDLHL